MKIIRINFILILSYFVFAENTAISQTWIRKADFGGIGRYSTAYFSIGNKGYIGMGCDTALVLKKDFWEWNKITNTWTQKADFGGGTAESPFGFSIGGNGYVVKGYLSNEFWEYDTATNIWTQKAQFPRLRVAAVSFSIGKKGYIATGNYSQELWEWDGDTASSSYNTWTLKAPFPLIAGRYAATGFSIGTKGYLGTGTDGATDKKDLWEWDGDTASPSYNTWTQKSSLPGLARAYAVGFSIGTQGYIGNGLNSDSNENLKDFWKWDQATDTWTQIIDFPGSGRQSPAGFSIGNRGYVGTGYDNTNLRDFWEYCDTCTVGIKEINNSVNIFIFPNPATSKVEIQLPEINEYSEMSLYNIFGQLIIRKEIKERATVIDLSEIAKGIYFIKINANNFFYYEKIIKN